MASTSEVKIWQCGVCRIFLINRIDKRNHTRKTRHAIMNRAKLRVCFACRELTVRATAACMNCEAVDE